MPLYEYKCSDGHRTPILRKVEDRNLPTECDCGKPASLAVSTPGRGIVTGSDTPGQRFQARNPEGFVVTEETDTLIVREKGTATGVNAVDWVCANGHTHLDVVVGAVPSEGPPCPTCGGATTRKADVPTVDWFTAAGYHATGGYWCNGLGRWIHSLEDRRRVMEELGVREGGDDSGQVYRDAARAAQIEREDREVAEMIRSCEADPDLQRRREAGDPQVPDWTWAKDDLTARGLY